MDDNEREKLIQEIADLNAEIVSLNEAHKEEVKVLNDQLDKAFSALSEIYVISKRF